MSSDVISWNEGNFQAPPPPPANGATPPPPPPETPAPEGTGGEINVLMVILAYFGILCLIPFFAEKDDEFVQYHARQGLTMFLAEVAIFIVLIILSMIPFLGCIIMILELFFWLGVLVYHIILMVKASKGERTKVPYISTYAERWFK
ncbi:MAG: DUF4870 domain-containing protein [Acidobacteria bacterium]|nr:DUF4870 domain-containing protein [Acidobacteriota bacterium]